MDFVHVLTYARPNAIREKEINLIFMLDLDLVEIH